MILHTINKPSALADCQFSIGMDDCVLLMEDGVYLGLQTELPGIVYALTADVQARGIGNKLKDSIQVIDYQRFVALSLQADKVCAWF